jgi:hypothetical protein
MEYNKMSKMIREKRIEQEAASTLQYLDRVEDIEPGPFFYARVNAKIDAFNKTREHRFSRLFGMQMLRTAFIVLLILVNLFSAVKILQWVNVRFDSRVENITAVARAYFLTRDSGNVFIQYPTSIER